MKHWVGIVIALLLSLQVAPVSAEPPAAITIHGSLTASDNSPVTGARDYSVTFYDASMSGNALGGALTGTVTLTDKGLFNIAITPPNEIFTAAQVWYELAIDSDTPTDGVDADDVFVSRTQVQSVPFAKQAGNVGLPENGTAHVVVQTTDNAVTNAANLLAAYAAAKALTPGGAALSASNRAVVLVSPGAYDLGASTFAIDTDYVDLVGLSSARDGQRIYGASTHVLTQTASNIRIENLLFHYTGGSGDINAYYPNASGVASPPATIIRNCEFRVNNSAYLSMRPGVEYAGRYDNCLANGNYAFGGNGGTASGIFTNCTGSSFAFGGIGGTASGTFKDCTGGDAAFASYFGIASGTFNDCTGGDGAFGGYNGTADSGKFFHCFGGVSSFTETGSPAPYHHACFQNGALYSGND